MVTSLVDGGNGSLRQTIGEAASGDTIRFGITGTFTLTLGRLVIDKDLTIEGPGDPNLILLERTRLQGAPAFGIFVVDEATVTFSGLTISNGRSAGGGGGLNAYRSTVSIRQCVFRDNVSLEDGGGAILNSAGTMYVEECRFVSNKAEDFIDRFAPESGGAIHNSARSGLSSDGHARLEVHDSIFSGNRSGEFGGGAISGSSFSVEFGDGEGTSTVLLSGCTFSNNSGRNGGAVRASGYLGVDNCTFSGNSAGREGGAMYSFGTTSIESCTFADNRAEQDAGALYLLSNSAIVRGSLFSGNWAPTVGAAIANNRNVLLQNCTFDANGSRTINNIGSLMVQACTLRGGSLLAQSGLGSSQSTIGNTILDSRNSFSISSGTVVSAGYNLSWDDADGFLTGPGDQIHTSPNLDPLGPRDHGGPTHTIALMADSPALDQGHSMGLTMDQRGVPRPHDLASYPAVPGGDNTDIGAFESTDPVQTTAIVVNTLDDHDDGIAGVADCTLREAIGRANALDSETMIRFAPGVAGVIMLDRHLGPLTITGSPHIEGPGARLLAIDADRYHRVLTVNNSGGLDKATISGLTLRRGFHGGALPGEPGSGGGILNRGTLTLEECTLEGHYAKGEQGPGIGGHGGAGRGGGIYNEGVLTLNRCTLRNCVVGGGNGTPDPDPFAAGGNGGAAEGGAIYNASPYRSLTVTGCTFFDNEASGGHGGNAHFAGNGGHARGGAIFNAGTMALTGTTISGNDGLGGFGGVGSNLFNNGAAGPGIGGVVTEGVFGTATLRSTLCAENLDRGNVPADVNGSFLSGGYNLIGTAEGSTGFAATGDQTGTIAAPVDPKLVALADNGGPTDTMMLLAGSPAIDRGNAFGQTVDQRGQARTFDIPTLANAPGGDGTDVGALEFPGALIVTTLDDHDDGAATADDTTLREAIHAAIARPGTEVIGFQGGLTGVIELTGPLPDLGADMFIEGPGAGLLAVRRNGGGDYRVFTVTGGAFVSISGLAVSNGNAGAGAFPADSGGGILNDRSRLTLRNCRIAGNNAVSGFTYGGGVFNHEGTLVVESCHLADNHAYYGGGLANYLTTTGGLSAADVTGTTFSGNTGSGGYGGALFNSAVGGGIARTTITNSTLSANRANAGFGGAIYNSAANSGVGTLTLTHGTLSGNSAPAGGGIYNFNFNGTANVNLRNTILHTGDSGANLVNFGGAISSQGYNLSNDAAGGDATTDPGGLLNATGDVRNTDPLLGDLADNGGPTPTHLPLLESPARDRGNSFGFGTDQRGFARVAKAGYLPHAPGGDGTDIGSVELSPFGSAIDADGDGMSDRWEDFYDLDDPFGDADGDGAINLSEHHAGSDPRDPHSTPVFDDDATLTIVDVLGKGSGGPLSAILRVSGPPGVRVRIESSESLSPPWAGFAGSELVVPPSGLVEVEHGGGSGPRMFYRLASGL